MVEDLAGFRAYPVGQQASLSGADRPPPLAGGGFNLRSLVLEPGKPGFPRGPDDAGALGRGFGVWGAFFDILHKHEVLAAGGGRASWLEPVTKADAGKWR